MTKFVAGAAAWAWGGLFVVASAAAEPSASDRAGNELDCAHVSAEARNYGYGYNHVLTLSNQCQRAVSCEVWTNVDPTAPQARGQAGPERECSRARRLAVTRCAGGQKLQVPITRANASTSVDGHARRPCAA